MSQDELIDLEAESVPCERCGELIPAASWDRDLCQKCKRIEVDEENQQAWGRELVRHRALIRAGYTCVGLAILICPAVFGLVGGAIGVSLIVKGSTRHGTTITVLSIIVVFLASLVGLFLLSRPGR